MDSEAFLYSSDIPVLVDFILLQRFILRRLGEGDVVTDRDRGAGITKAYLFMRLLPRVLPSIQRAKALRTQIPDMPLQSDRASPSPYRTYSSYPAEGKVSFS